jgi:hypothetical protein
VEASARACNADERGRGNRRYATLPPRAGVCSSSFYVIADRRNQKTEVERERERRQGIGCFGLLRDRAVGDPLAGAKAMREVEIWRPRVLYRMLWCVLDKSIVWGKLQALRRPMEPLG